MSEQRWLEGSRAEHRLQPAFAMRFRELRRILEQVVLAGLPASLGACFVDDLFVGRGACVERVERTLTAMVPADPPLQLRIDRCRVDVDACKALCAMAMERAQEPGHPSLRCDVEFRGAVFATPQR